MNRYGPLLLSLDGTTLHAPLFLFLNPAHFDSLLTAMTGKVIRRPRHHGTPRQSALCTRALYTSPTALCKHVVQSLRPYGMYERTYHTSAQNWTMMKTMTRMPESRTSALTSVPAIAPR